MNEQKTITKTAGAISVTGHFHWIGQDLSATYSGGDKSHIGAVAIVQRTPRAKDPSQYTHTPSVHALVGHKEYGLAQELAMKLAQALNTNLVCLVGIHVDAAGPEEIETIIRLTHEITDDFLR